ncbi:LysR family transcriptional regulator [Vibrio sp. DW001]|uniref:LysR family transcriptional regulator n=1 Tax=Vibrio sp. DW001 TaxID=2912315 RepID=UPI0023B203B0|nr:LysR family transcriptional regulator [Vibrio sp. DW001]WED25656.1 LysR family transcriptional regulator [Vibrio sp. DW001]
MDKVTAAKVFIDVAYTGSFTVSSERLDMSRPMVTRYVEAMEAWFDARLLHRSTRKVSLTTIGAQYLNDIEQWVDDADKMVNLVKSNEELQGSIRIATSMSFGHSRLIPALTDFMVLHPKVTIDVDLQDLATDMIKNRIDLAIRITSSPDPSLIGKRIAKCRSVLVASPEYLARSANIHSPEDLKSHQCLGYKNFERHVWHLNQGDELQSVEVNCRLTANEATALMQAAEEGAGVALQPTYLVNPLIKREALLQVLPNWTPQEMDIFVLYPSRKHLSPTVRALIDFLSDYFQCHKWE